MYTFSCKFCSKLCSSKDKRKTFCGAPCYNSFRTGGNNHFWGKTHTNESLSKMKTKLSALFKGDNNPFFGQNHSELSKLKMKAGQAKYRAESQSKLLADQLSRLNLSLEKLRLIFEEYKISNITQKEWGEKYDVDHRVLKKYILFFDICTASEFSDLTFRKKYRKSSSAAEDSLYQELLVYFDSSDLERQVKLSPYSFDFRIKNDVLVEYDGYYWHQILPNNDVEKTKLAEDIGIPLYRVLEPFSRKVDFKSEALKIKEFYEAQKDRKHIKSALPRPNIRPNGK